MPPLSRRRAAVAALALAWTASLPATTVLAQGASGAALESVLGRPAAPNLSFSAFGTLGYAALDDESAEYRSGVARDGADADGSLVLDTRVGLQLDTRLTSKLSGTVQLIGRESGDGDPEAGLEWGLLRYLPTDSIAVRVGRMSLPVFALSDFREVGYANVFLRPPEDVYAQVPLRRIDGVDLTYDTEIGDTLLRAQLFTGRSSESLYDGLELDGKGIVGAAFAVERGPFRARIGHVVTRLEITSEGGGIEDVRAALLQASATLPDLAAVAEDFAPGRVPLSFDTIGASYDEGRWFVDAEYARRRVDNWVADLDSWSLAGGVRVASFTPYAFVSALDDVEEDRRITLPGFDALESGVNMFYEPRDQQSVGAGLRWDARPGLALKGQVESVSREVTGQSLRRASDGMRDGGDDVVLYSVALDFIF